MGALGGFIAWGLTEMFFGRALAQDLPTLARFGLDAFYGLLSGLILGLALGIGHRTLTRRRWWIPPLSATLGSVGGCVGLLWGEAFFQLLRSLELPARTIGWALFGFILGSSQGIARGSWAGAKRAGIGGALGGAIGGLLFALLPFITNLPDPTCRGLAWVLMGALIGSTSVLFERLLAGATLKVASGRLEGKEFVLDKPKLSIGRDERCDIPLYYDRNIRPRHATLEWSGTSYRLKPVSGATVIVNGQLVPVKELSHNDVLLIGNTRLVYRLRAGKARFLCANCYAPNRKDAKFCRNCGKPFLPLELPKEPVTQWLKQAGIAISVLLVCLVISYALGSWMGQRTAAVVTTTPAFSKTGASLVRRWEGQPLRLAVTPEGFDDIGSVLKGMKFSPAEINFGALTSSYRLQSYDIVFLNCHSQLLRFSDGEAIKKFVADGGVIYASDFAAAAIQSAFPDIVTFERGGPPATLEAEVVDPTLMDKVGRKVKLEFDLAGWWFATSWDRRCRVYLRAKDEGRALLFSFRYGKGFVIYTSFHNKAQTSEMERKLIEFLALRPLTMRLSQQVEQEIAQPVEVGTLGQKQAGGLLSGRRMVMRREIVGTIGTGQTSPVYQFQLVKPSAMKIVIGWEGGDGDFTIAVWSKQNPSRRWKEGAKTPPLVLTVQRPLPAGTYCLRLTAHKAPLPETPFVIGVGLKKEGER